MASAAAVITYIKDRMFQNVFQLITGTKAQEAVLYVVNNCKNKDDYDTEQAALISSISSFDARITVNEGDITALESDVNDIQLQVNQHDADIDNLTSSIGSNLKIQRESTTSGNKTISLSEGALLKAIGFNTSGGTLTVKIGSTLGGSEICPDFETISVGVIPCNEFAETDKTIYLTCSGSTFAYTYEYFENYFIL